MATYNSDNTIFKGTIDIEASTVIPQITKPNQTIADWY